MELENYLKIPICDCCQRPSIKVHSSILWHDTAKLCEECVSMWYDPSEPGVDQTCSVSIGNAVRKKHGLPPL